MVQVGHGRSPSREIIMKTHSLLVTFTLGFGLVAATEAQAWFADIDDERPPPNGANGLSANGMVINGFLPQSAEGAGQIKAIVLTDGTRIGLK
jgi:hypothetical protein